MIRISETAYKLTLLGDEKDIYAVYKALRVRPKGYFHSPRYKAYELTDGREGWDGFMSPLYLIGDPATSATCLRGHKDTVIREAREMDITLDLQDCLVSPFKHITPDDIPEDIINAPFALDEYQRESVAHWLKNGMGVNNIAVNGGKTAMFAAAAAMVKERFGNEAKFLYCTQSERLARQVFKEMRSFLPDWDITQYGGGEKNKNGRDMVVATIAMLWSNMQDLRRSGWFSEFIGVLYDESHHACSPTSKEILRHIPAFFRLGASNTHRITDPARAAQIRGLLGPIRYTVPVSTYIDMGRSATPTIYIVENPEWKNCMNHIPYRAEPDTPAWALVEQGWKKGMYVGPVYELDENGKVVMRLKGELAGTEEIEVSRGKGVRKVKTAVWERVEVPVTIPGFHRIQFEGERGTRDVESTYCLLERATDKSIVTFKPRNQLITQWTKYYSRDCGYPTIVVCTRTLHVFILQSLLSKLLGEQNVRILFSEHGSKERDQTFDWFRSTKGSVLITPLVKEGVSINEIRAGVIADYVGDWEVANQIIGRFIRKKKGQNEAHVTWFYDNQHPTLRTGCQRVFARLFDVPRYKFYRPVLGPDTIPKAKVYEKQAD